MKSILAAVAAVTALTGVAAAAAAAPRAQVSGGTLSGTTEAGVSAFLGVPYAAPPTGPNRWRAPQSAPAWSGVRAADQFAASCWQAVTDKGFGPWTSEYVVHGKVSEDCLYLNVWTPAHAAGRKLPVLVWIHGGGFTGGSGSVPIYDGAALAAKGVVVVNINYRLGVLGFLAHPGLTREANGAPPANFGLQDMIAALRWVRENISAFGGDPDQVTISGQSAGSIAVHDLIVSPLAKGLFQRAIAESGLPDTVPPTTLAAAERDGEAYARSKGAASIQALRALPPEALDSPFGQGPRFAPIVDGVLVPEAPSAALAAGRYNHTPVLAGLNADEGSAMSPGYGSADAAAFTALVQRLYGPMADRVARLYPASTEAERSQASRELLGDRGLAALYAWRRERAGEGRVYAYLFTHAEPGPEAAHYRAFHSAELPYVFGTLDKSPERPFTAEDRALSQTLATYWVNFIKTGDPNGAGLAAWPTFRAPGFDILELGGDAPKARPVLSPDKRAVVDDFLGQGGKPGLF